MSRALATGVLTTPQPQVSFALACARLDSLEGQHEASSGPGPERPLDNNWIFVRG
jgi:hypothetical protein